MQPDQARAAFTLTPVHQRRDSHRITSVGVDQGGKRLFVGLSNGFIEEHSINRGHNGCYTRVTAEKRISRHPVKSIYPISAAQRLAILSEDGSVSLCAYETYELTSVSQAKGATALAVECSSNYPARLAIAVPVSKKKSKILLYAVVAGTRASSSSGTPIKLFGQLQVEQPVKGLVWIGQHMLAAVPGGYLLITSSSTTPVAEHLTCSTMLAAIPSMQQVMLLFQDTLALITDSQGHAQRPPLLLPSTPLALGQAGLYVAAVCEDGIYVFDRNSSQQVQHIDFLHDDPYIAVSRRMPCSDDSSGALVMLATSEVLYCLEPIALEQQVRDLLKRKRFQQALELLELCGHEEGGDGGGATEGPAATGAAWLQEALAQAGLLLLLDLQFGEAVQVLLRCSPAVFQPCELLPLFPSHCQQWLPQLHSRPHWGLHGALPELSRLVADACELKQATMGSGSCSARSSSVNAAGAGATAPAQLPSAQELQHTARQQLAGYLQQARQQRALEMADAVDTLLACLLCEVGDAAALEQLVRQPRCLAAPPALALMQASGRWHALALYRSSHGQSAEALQLWRQLGEGEVQEAGASSGAVHEAGGEQAQVALAQVARELCSDQVAAHVVLQQLPWLLQRSPEASLGVLTARELPVHQVLELLAERSDDLRWQFLQHVVHTRACQDPLLHTELALLLVDSIQSAAKAAGLSKEQLAAAAPGALEQQAAQQGQWSAQHSRSPSMARSARHSTLMKSVPSFDHLARAVSPGPELTRRSGSGALPSPRSLTEQHSPLMAMQRQGSGMPATPRATQQSHPVALGWPPELQRVATMRSVLLAHLQRSQLYDVRVVLQALRGSTLHHEQVELHTRLCDYDAALRLLALVIADVDAAICYCRQHGGQEGWLALLDMLLRPGDGRQPNYVAACRVLNAEGATLNPLKVLQSLSDDMPLHLAHETLSRMLAGMEHRRRHCQVVRALHRGQNLALRAEVAELQSARVVVGEGTPCRGCQRLLGDRVFWRYPSGVVMCSRCMQMADVAVPS